jgi:hypothetical protein
MSDDLSITRGRYAWENAGREITPADVRALIAADASLSETAAGDGLLGVRWGAHPRGVEVTLWLLDGNLVARQPDRPTITLLVDLAARLDGRVVGDEGEVYARDGTWTHAEAETASGPAEPARRTFLRSLFGRAREPARVAGARSATAAFRKGDRVRDPWGNKGIVTGVEFVNGGALDIVIVRFDDGRERRMSLLAHGLQKLDAGA